MNQMPSLFDGPTYSVAPFPGGSLAGARRSEVAERVRRFLPMVRRLAWHVQGSGGRAGIELEDLMQAGLVALTECAQTHEARRGSDPAGGVEDGFAAYAKMRVRGAMVDMVRRAVPGSRGGSEKRRQMASAQDTLRTSLGREPTARELASTMRVDESEVLALRDGHRPLRFEPLDESYSDQSMAFADDTPDAHDLLADAQTRGALIEAIGDLPERLRLIVQLYFVEELNLSEIAGVLDVSVPRVHQLKAQALAQLKQSLAGIADML